MLRILCLPGVFEMLSEMNNTSPCRHGDRLGSASDGSLPGNFLTCAFIVPEITYKKPRCGMSIRRRSVRYVRRSRLKPARTGGKNVRVMVMVKATKASEAGVMPDERLLTEMGKYNEELVKAGIMLAGEGLHPSSRGKRVRFSGARRTVIDGPFTETKELIAGFWLWQVKSMEEAVEWLKRCPNPNNEESDVEIRPVFEADDFGEEFTPELREQEQRIREQAAARQK